MRFLIVAAAVCVLAGVGAAAARADAVNGTARPELLVGTKRADRIAAEGGGTDRVRCGAGRDVVTADRVDKVAADCEVVSVRASTDPYRNSNSQHQTQVEPDSFAFGSTVVGTFQSGRFFDGGASNIGWTSSTDGGKTWRSGFLPGLTQFSAPPGAFPRVSDPAVAYDAVHGVWLISSLGFSGNVNAMLISRSRDGRGWGLPVTAVRSTTDLGFDKEWIACDNWPASPFRGHCYLTYADFGIGHLMTATSADGGLSWSVPVPSTPQFQGEELNGTQPVVRPDGTLVVVFAGDTDLEQVVSTDGGATFAAPTTVASIVFANVPGIRASPFPSAEVDAAGTIFVAWTDCGARSSCSGDDIRVTHSLDGRTWSAPVRVPTGARQAGHSYFMPGIAADPVTAGHLGITYYEMAACACRIDTSYIGSQDGGATWGKPQRLNARSMKPAWLARTSLGLMLGDYISTSVTGGKPVPVFALASPPSGASLREATFVTTRGLS